MNPVPLFLIIVSLPLLLGGCGGDKKEPVVEVKPVEEKQQKVKEEIKPIEPVTDAKAEPDGVNIKESKVSDGIRYLKDSDTPYTGKVFTLHENGTKMYEGNYKDGKPDGLSVSWHENGQKWAEGN